MKVTQAVKGYIIDCRTRGRSGHTIEWYEQKLNVLAHWLSEEEEIDRLEEVTVTHLRSFILHVQSIQVGRTTINKKGDVTQISPLTVKGLCAGYQGLFYMVLSGRTD